MTKQERELLTKLAVAVNDVRGRLAKGFASMSDLQYIRDISWQMHALAKEGVKGVEGTGKRAA